MQFAKFKNVAISGKLAALLAIIAFSVYVNTLQNGYALDDDLVVNYNKYVNLGADGIMILLTTPHLKGWGPVANDTYRPLSLISFAIEHELWGNNPMISHLINVLIFALCTALLFLFLDRFLKRERTATAFAASLLFALHPVHTEVVANIKSRDELMCFLFAIGSLITYGKYASDGKIARLIQGTILLFLAYLSKETVVAFVAIIPLCFFFYQNEHRKRSIFITAASLLALTIYLAIRSCILQDVIHDTNAIRFIDNQLVKIPAGKSALATEILALGYYLRLLLVPYPLLCSYSYCTIPFAEFGDLSVIASLGAYLLLASAGIYRLIKIKQDPWAFAVLFYLFSIVLFSNIPFIIGAMFAERFAFFSSVGFCIFMALAWEWLTHRIQPRLMEHRQTSFLKPIPVQMLSITCILYGGLTYSRNLDWRNNDTIYNADVQRAPDNCWLCYTVGEKLITKLYDQEMDPSKKRAIADKAVTYLKKAVEAYPDYADAQTQLGFAYTKLQMTDSARPHCIKALELDPHNVKAITALASVYFTERNIPGALACCKRALYEKPDYVVEYGNIATCFLNMKQFDSAIVYYQRALLYTPNNKNLYGQLAMAYKGSGNVDSAMKYLQAMKKYNPTFQLP